jgi:hypothetical protein
MIISLSAHPLLGAHNSIAVNHNSKRAELKELKIKLAAAKEKVAAENAKRKLLVAKLATKIKALEVKKSNTATAAGRNVIAASIRELCVKMKDLQLNGPTSLKLQALIKQKTKLEAVIENLRHKHSASLALKQLYAIRKWTD